MQTHLIYNPDCHVKCKLHNKKTTTKFMFSAVKNHTTFFKTNDNDICRKAFSLPSLC